MATTPSTPLFTIPITHGKTTGSILCTQPAEAVYLLTFSFGPDNRLPTPFCDAFILALDILEHRYPAGAVITTSAVPKFYSNGMDIDHALNTGPYMHNALYKLFNRLLTYPRPTVAVLNGHAFAGGLMVAMAHDYRIMNPAKGFVCLNEIELGMPLLPPMMGIFRMKVAPQTLRKLTLEAARFKAADALKEGIVDRLGGVDDALAMVSELNLVGKAQPGMSGLAVYGHIKREAWRETVAMLEDFPTEAAHLEKEYATIDKDAAESLKRVEAWENVKAKL